MRYRRAKNVAYISKLPPPLSQSSSRPFWTDTAKRISRAWRDGSRRILHREQKTQGAANELWTEPNVAFRRKILPDCVAFDDRDLDSSIVPGTEIQPTACARADARSRHH